MIQEQIINTIDEIQGMLAKSFVKRVKHKSMRMIEAEAKGRALAMRLGEMIERSEER